MSGKPSSACSVRYVVTQRSMSVMALGLAPSIWSLWKVSDRPTPLAIMAWMVEREGCGSSGGEMRANVREMQWAIEACVSKRVPSKSNMMSFGGSILSASC